jgi:hypothetical protein
MAPLSVKVIIFCDATVPASATVGIKRGLAGRPEPEVWPVMPKVPGARERVSVSAGASASTDRVTFWLACGPVVTKFSSASTIDTETFELKFRSLAAVVGAETNSFAAAPWVIRTVWVVDVNPLDAKVRV